jgi:phage FluMu protein Com
MLWPYPPIRGHDGKASIRGWQANQMPSSPAKNGGPVMLEFKCPQARKPVHVEVSGNTEAVKSNWTREIRVRCPHCQAVHWFSYRTGYIEAALTQLNRSPATRDATSA